MNTIGYFEIQSSNPQREITFYADVFGWKFKQDTTVPIEYYRIESAGINGAMLLRPAKVPGDHFGTNAFCCSVEVTEFDMTAKKILEKMPQHKTIIRPNDCLGLSKVSILVTSLVALHKSISFIIVTEVMVSESKVIKRHSLRRINLKGLFKRR